jgi:cobalt/nickel transport system ATP-binding protein
MSEVVIEAHDLRVRYPDGRVVETSGIPLRVHAGERVALLGPNGSGKSTLLRAVLGLLKTEAGSVRVFGRDPAREFDAIRPRVGAVLQDVEAQLLAPTVAEDLAFGLSNLGLSRAEIEARVREMAECCALTGLLGKVPHYLSGGERRKVALAGALVPFPELLVLDEPFASLDPRSRAEIARHLREEHERRRPAVLLTTHEVEELPDLVDTVYIMAEGGRMVGNGRPEEVFAMDELLAASNIKPPVLAGLVVAMRSRGYSIPLSYDVEQVANALVRQVEAQ